MRHPLEARWRRFWSDRNVQQTTMVEDAFGRLLGHYTDPARGYHSITHIEYGLNLFEEVRHLAVNPDAVEAAWWYHDVIYDPKASDNELKSADYADSDLTTFGQSPHFVIAVGDNILATLHRGGLVKPDQQLICDIDLSSLGTPSWPEMCRNSRGIRTEYQHVPEEVYVEKRREILGTFLKREHLFYTQYFRDRFEAQAKENIAHEIEVLPFLAGLPK